MREQKNHITKVYIVGDNHIMRSGLRKIIETQAAIRVLGEVSVRRANVETLLRYNPDLVLVDLDPRSTDVLGFISTCHEALKDSAVLVLSDLADHELAHKALALGAAGIVLKMQPPAVLIAAIREICPACRDNSAPKPGAINDRPTHNLIKLSDDPENMIKVDSLTPRERDIVRLICLGLKNKDIANRLSISDITVRHHLTSIFCKLEVPDRQNLLILAHRYGLADLTLSTESI